MAEKTKGYVSYVGSNTFKGKALWSFRISNNDNWFRTGLVKPAIEKGNLIEFEATQVNGGYNVDVSSINVITIPDGNVTTGGVGSIGNRGAGSTNAKDQYWEDKAREDKERDLRIQYQSARNAAISVVDILLREKAIKLPDKLGASYDVILGKIDDLTEKYFADSSRDPADENASAQEGNQAA